MGQLFLYSSFSYITNSVLGCEARDREKTPPPTQGDRKSHSPRPALFVRKVCPHFTLNAPCVASLCSALGAAFVHKSRHLYSSASQLALCSLKFVDDVSATKAAAVDLHWSARHDASSVKQVALCFIPLKHEECPRN